MNDGIPECFCDHGKPTGSNGPCNSCKRLEVCKKAAEMNRRLKEEILEKVDFWIAIVQGVEAK